MKKLRLFLKLHGLKVAVGLFFLGVFLMAAFFMKSGLENYFQLESFSRRQLSAMMGFFLIINLFAVFIQIPLFFGMHYYFLQGGGMAKMGKESMALAKVNVKWDQVIGMADAKREAWELVKLLKDRSLLKVIGGKIIKGTIMFGPPGCGKTYLAKAIATECGMPIISATGSDFIGMFVGQGAAQMKALFKQARETAKIEGGCLIFIDEIDSFARPRQQDQGFGGTLSNNATINQFLTEMDGMRQAENNIVIIAATNATEEDLDSAIMRAGRFDRKIYVTKPNLEERKKLFDFYLSRVESEKNIDTSLLARKALWFSPSDIDNMVREAGLIALRENRKQISTKDLSGAYDRVTFGMKSNITMSDAEKLWTAYHEAGHAVIAYLMDTTRDVIKATIIPHKGSLGFISQRPKEELHNTNKENLLAQIKVSLASYAAEKMKFGTTSAGVGGGRGSDFDTAMRIAHTMVWQYGMGKTGLIGDFHATERVISETTRAKLDDDVQDLLQSCMREVESVLTKHRALLDRFASELVKKEELEYDEILKIFTEYGLESSVRDDLKS